MAGAPTQWAYASSSKSWAANGLLGCLLNVVEPGACGICWFECTPVACTASSHAILTTLLFLLLLLLFRFLLPHTASVLTVWLISDWAVSGMKIH